jgi:2,5-diketo-D-gluconate reductase A
MISQPRVTLNDRRLIPQVGLGVWQTSESVAGPAVQVALLVGYRHVDTAEIYENERGVGEGIRASGIAREDIFVTTKLWNEAQGFDSTLKAIDGSLSRLGLDYIDLYLIHWRRRAADFTSISGEEGRVRSIGVSNFEAEHLKHITGETGVVPVLNQIELHPRFQQRKLREVHAKLGIDTQSWSPLGRGTLFSDPTIGTIAARYRRTPAQVIIRWHLDSGLIVIPKSVTPSRIAENFDVFDFDMAAIAKLNSSDGRIGPDPMTATF